jgi:hypothetical protein
MSWLLIITLALGGGRYIEQRQSYADQAQCLAARAAVQDQDKDARAICVPRGNQ